jgi:hypothetical protein
VVALRQKSATMCMFVTPKPLSKNIAYRVEKVLTLPRGSKFGRAMTMLRGRQS